MARKTRPYYTLISRTAHQPWTVEFGDYDRANVKFEMGDIRAGARRNGDRMELRIIKTPTAARLVVEAAIANLNKTETVEQIVT